MTTTKSKRRKIKLIKPRLQLRLIGAFAGISIVALTLQYLMVVFHLTDVTSRLPDGGESFRSFVPSLLWRVLAPSLLFALPLTLIVGVSLTFRIVGPIYRFEQFLRAAVEGRREGPCRIREGDELQELCELINRFVESRNERDGDGAEEWRSAG